MDNRNDLQWRPEDWEHTLGHLRKAERLLMLKTWGVGIAVAGTVVTAAALYFQPESIADVPEVADRVEAVESAQPAAASAAVTASESEVASGSVDAAVDAASASIAWAEAVEVSEAAEVLSRGLSEIPANIPATPAPATPAPVTPAPVAAAPANAAFTSAATGSNRELRQAILEADAEAEVEIENALSLLERLGPMRISHNELPLLGRQQLEGVDQVVEAKRNLLPLRLSALPVQKGLSIECPVTVGWLAQTRVELTPGLNVATAPVQWSAWHPGDVFGAPPMWRQAHSDLAIASQLTVSGMKALGPLLEVGVSAGLQHEMARRLDHGIWDPDANDWSTLLQSRVWGRVEEASPWSAVAALRLDYAVAPEWKAVVHVGRTLAPDLSQKQPAIDVSTSTPLWVQIGIQR